MHLITIAQASDAKYSKSEMTNLNPNVVSPKLITSGPDDPVVELIYFSCKKVKKGVQLSWRTASEINTSFFFIEKSTDSTIFKEIGFVKAAGKSLMVNDYTIEDPNYENKLTYYRLKYFGPNGNYSYSGVISLNSKTPAIKYDPNNQDHDED